MAWGCGTLLTPLEKPIFYLYACFKLASQAPSWREPSSQARSYPCISESPVLYSFTAVSYEAAL